MKQSIDAIMQSHVGFYHDKVVGYRYGVKAAVFNDISAALSWCKAEPMLRGYKIGGVGRIQKA